MRYFLLPAILLASVCPVSAGTNEVAIIFDKEPQMQGMTFERNAMSPDVVDIKGQKVNVWTAQQGSAPGMAWARSVMITVTDNRFTAGKMPVVDLEVVYKNNSHAPVLLKADTSRGPVEIGSSFGESDGFQTMKIRLDDAFFGQRRTNSDPMKAEPDGCDIRLTAFNSDIQIRSIRIVGYDRDTNPDYSRLLRLTGVTTDPDDIFLFHPEQKAVLNFQVDNLAMRPLDAQYVCELKDGTGKLISRSEGKSIIAGMGGSKVPYAVDTAGMKNGIYYVNFKLWKAGSSGGAPLLERETSFGISSAARIPKAKPGEFLYGLDVRLGGAYHNPMLLRWADAIGVDIIRHGFDSEGSLEEVRARLPIYEKAGLQVMFICSPRWNENAGERLKSEQASADFLEKLASEFKQIRFYELGNEPDLKFFYPGPIEDYYAGYVQFYDAIKRGNPNTVVTNGGLSFFGPEGDQRSRRLIELIDPAKIDAIAYHGHGPGVGSERSALTRIKAVAAQFGKGNKPFVETESGLAAKTLLQQQSQARTVIEKMVFAQSENEPLLMWFRLIMFEEDYGSLNSEREPRPAVLAYRATVEALRGFTFSSLLDSRTASTEVYHFSQKEGAGHALVVWSNTPAAYSIYVAAGTKGEAVLNARVIDMFGNSTTAAVLADGSITVPVSEDPVFVKWESSEPEFQVRCAPLLIDAGSVVQVVGGTDNPLIVHVRNPFDRPLEATVKASVSPGIPASLETGERKISLKPLETSTVAFTIAAKQAPEPVRWPESWTIFLGADLDAAQIQGLTRIPTKLAAGNGTDILGRVAFPRDATIDFTSLGATVHERAPAMAFADVESDADRTVTVGAGADWWMAWYLNGKPVYDTLEAGNKGAVKPTAHEFKLALKRGTNLLAVKVLSGSGAFKLAFADPALLSGALNPETGVEGVNLTFSADGKSLATSKVAVTYTRPLPVVDASALSQPVATWERIKPTCVLDETTLHNLFDKFPDSNKWWKGANDHSGIAWLSCDAARLNLLVKVSDDTHSNSGGEKNARDGDSLEIGLSRNGTDGINIYRIARTGGSDVVAKEKSTFGLPPGILSKENREIIASVERAESVKEGDVPSTVYRVSIDRKIIGQSSFFINLLVNDTDGDSRKQYLEWRPGLEGNPDARQWYRTTFGN